MENQKRRGKPVRPLLPDDVIMDILSRLPADDVLKYRRVCRRWKDLTSTQYFAEMHMKASSSPMILVQERGIGYSVRDLLLIDKWEPPRKKTRTRKLCLSPITSESTRSYCFRLSYRGLIVMKRLSDSSDLRDFIIFNPITGDNVSIIIRYGPGGYTGEIFAMFFHPQIKEYCILWGWFLDGPQVRCKIISLGPQPYSKDLTFPPSLLYEPRVDPVVIDDSFVYWTVRSRYDETNHIWGDLPSCEERIMAFDIKTEEFTVMPHPGLGLFKNDRNCCRRISPSNNILKMEGRLGFVQSTYSATSPTIHIWTLEDHASRLWIKSHTVNIVDNIGENLEYRELRAVVFGNGELVMEDTNTRLYSCNLELGKLRTFGRKAYGTYGTYKYRQTTNIIVAHIPSFISLNCKSEILIEENHEPENE